MNRADAKRAVLACLAKTLRVDPEIVSNAIDARVSGGLSEADAARVHDAIDDLIKEFERRGEKSPVPMPIGVIS